MNRSLKYDKDCGYMKLCNLFYDYAHIHDYHSEPFTALEPDIFIQACSFLLNSTSIVSLQKSVSIVKVAFVFINLAIKMGAFQCTRLAYTRLQTLHITPSLEDNSHVDMMPIEVEPQRVDFSKLPVCFGCGSSQPYINRMEGNTDGHFIGYFCVICKNPHMSGVLLLLIYYHLSCLYQ